ncbi:hypothetical protein T492DRAFT_379545 [Pavlovales sp. CCMP2436]|nr:hypothetical protein T492DRAFT_379545 [Pavlovales sp. CCMP2436]
MLQLLALFVAAAAGAMQSNGAWGVCRQTHAALRMCAPPAKPDDATDGLERSFERAAHAALSALAGETWRTGRARRTVGFSLAEGDWVRRVAADWPRIVVGTANGDVVVADLPLVTTLVAAESPPLRSRGELARATSAHSADEDAVGVGERALLGIHDKGAVTAVDLHGDLVASGGRDGCARVWQLPAAQVPAAPVSELQRLGCVRHCGPVTAVLFEGVPDAPGCASNIKS